MRNKYLLIFGFILGIAACNPKMKPNTPYIAEVNFLYKDAQGTIGVKSVGYGKNNEDAIMDAQENAFNVILFKGLPGTEMNIPLVENEYEAKSRNPKYFKKFFNDQYYKTFLMSSNESSNLIDLKNTKKISVDIKINYNSLRKDLEINQIIRKFGY